ncbi:hypothetical protein ACI2L1_12000 [Streptomyces sp. NPDC019531]|uniref:helix-turn-helix domain-containing protein n=1 Tax=Streptomyces sp. NPDC019531 TaxID=3365062 RepID=UPI00384F6679
MPKSQKPPTGASQEYALTINQVVSHNLGKARRSRGWTQEEAARRLEAASGKKWTAATLSASERAVATSRPRIFDANELITFARVFEYPVVYFLLPIEPDDKKGTRPENFHYFLARPGEADGHQSEPLLDMSDLLYSVIPLRYPAAVIDTVNRLLSPKGIVWQPYAEVAWDHETERDDYDTWRSLNETGEGPPVSLDDWKTIVDFVTLQEKIPAPRLLRLMADALDTPVSEESFAAEDPPF